ncbi:MAG TPA: enoyl-CoA hydratase/isomerase family protein [Bacteroidia bacterium]|jgi:methylglutaconyl-CoA hydratase|nr:enoyl-CoA hydratase/isomerase family protein [Bacteroidia bacterium]
MSESGNVITHHSKGIATITFFHPQSNSLPGELLGKLAGEIEKAGADKTVKVIVIRSKGLKAFCAGASFDELIAIQNIAEGKRFFSGFAQVINAMRQAPKFVLVGVQGKAVGGGVGIACAGDYTIATEEASVKLSELAVGIGPFVVGPAVERKIGTSAFCQLTIDATEWETAQWAREKGMYMEVCSDIPEMEHALQTLAEKLALSNPEAMRMLKQVMWKGTEHWDTLLLERAEMSGTLVLSDFTRNAINKFKEKAK